MKLPTHSTNLSIVRRDIVIQRSAVPILISELTSVIHATLGVVKQEPRGTAYYFDMSINALDVALYVPDEVHNDEIIEDLKSEINNNRYLSKLDLTAVFVYAENSYNLLQDCRIAIERTLRTRVYDKNQRIPETIFDDEFTSNGKPKGSLADVHALLKLSCNADTDWLVITSKNNYYKPFWPSAVETEWMKTKKVRTESPYRKYRPKSLNAAGEEVQPLKIWKKSKK